VGILLSGGHHHVKECMVVCICTREGCGEGALTWRWAAAESPCKRPAAAAAAPVDAADAHRHCGLLAAAAAAAGGGQLLKMALKAAAADV
jgi:hypothetical protein